MSIRVMHLITGLGTGGAETVLFRLLSGMDRSRFESCVACLTSDGPVGAKIRALGIPVTALDMPPGRLTVQGLSGLLRLVKGFNPDILQTWLYHADLLGGLAGFACRIPVVWGLHNTSLDPSAVKRTTILVAHLNALLSHFLPRRIISCSETARASHIRMGFNASKFVVIPNGFDLSAFHPDPSARASLRGELGLSADTFLVGLVARFDPLKDHHTFVRAAGKIYASQPQAHFVLCGDGVSWENDALAGWIDAAGIRSNCHLLGRRADMPRLMAALDVLALSSIGEAFPNVLGEAMSCGIPCVATDVGDAANIVGPTGVIVPPGDSEALASGVEKLIGIGSNGRQKLGDAARQRVQDNFEISQIVGRYETIYQDTC